MRINRVAVGRKICRDVLTGKFAACELVLPVAVAAELAGPAMEFAVLVGKLARLVVARVAIAPGEGAGVCGAEGEPAVAEKLA